jgi:sugar (pentulose or hexulose) kinase
MRVVAAALLLTMPAAALKPGVALGVDLGTSGVRVAIVEKQRAGGGVSVIEEASAAWSDAEGRVPEVWLGKLRETLRGCTQLARVGAVSVSGTSGSCLLVDATTGAVTRGPLMYNDAVELSQLIDTHAPPLHTTRSSTSALAKLLHWAQERPLDENEVVCHQADYVAAALASGPAFPGGPVLVSDWHNALKMGFDVDKLEWPAWILDGCLTSDSERRALTQLRVARPGDICERVVSQEASEAWSLPAGAPIVGGTTDSIAAFVACSTDVEAGALNIAAGDAVTSLGSTTAIKFVSDARVDDSSVGVYSHRLEDNWLVGGASNAGCRVLREFAFSDEELEELSAGLPVDARNAKGVYPLVSKGERFPYNDPNKEPVLPPRDGDRASVLEDLLVGIADVERLGYLALKERGASPLKAVATAGGGGRNAQWAALRSNMLGVDVVRAANSDAAFGAAVLALRG